MCASETVCAACLCELVIPVKRPCTFELKYPSVCLPWHHCILGHLSYLIVCFLSGVKTEAWPFLRGSLSQLGGCCFAIGRNVWSVSGGTRVLGYTSFIDHPHQQCIITTDAAYLLNVLHLEIFCYIICQIPFPQESGC